MKGGVGWSWRGGGGGETLHRRRKRRWKSRTEWRRVNVSDDSPYLLVSKEKFLLISRLFLAGHTRFHQFALLWSYPFIWEKKKKAHRKAVLIQWNFQKMATVLRFWIVRDLSMNQSSILCLSGLLREWRLSTLLKYRVAETVLVLILEICFNKSFHYLGWNVHSGYSVCLVVEGSSLVKTESLFWRWKISKDASCRRGKWIVVLGDIFN